MKEFNIKFCWFTLALFSDSALAYIQDTHITDGGLFVKPSLEMRLVHDDNIFNQQTGGKSSAISSFMPSLNLKMDDGVNYYSLDMNLEKGIYEASGEDDYTDADLGLSAHIEPNDTHRVDLSVKGEWLTEQRGTGISEGILVLIDEPITYGRNSLTAAYEYGSQETKGRIAFDFKYYEKEYRNFENITRRSNYDSLLVGSRFYYSTRAHTDAFIEVNAETIGYDYNLPGEFVRDSNVYTGFVGMQWAGSPVVNGFVKIGGQAKEFDDEGREDFTGFSWNVGGVWRPLTYSKVSLSTSQATKDPDIFGDYILETKYKVDWKHNWTSYIYTSVGVYKYKDDYSGITRVDDIYGYSLKLNYDLNQNVAIAVFGEWDRNQSTNAVFEYDKNVVGVNFMFTL
ncbi:outer membrane beta-barrel protein [Moritella sp. F3]|uniref:outer membrane beta-barrel protein n=1 Tax=Moritella sp. F3 TaxID=2718882 RepID=UPI0018E0FAD0|nr:outer membrane beta-barrel protein [Moritella sp. F3]GIC78950.1 capsular polysaccharide biosynthesis protein [Moritella sp. F1]GIC83527.1 capsular polysaccharide biosynthesis protein [Moritella sp. F3]